jgi:hypothetical protein
MSEKALRDHFQIPGDEYVVVGVSEDSREDAYADDIQSVYEACDIETIRHHLQVALAEGRSASLIVLRDADPTAEFYGDVTRDGIDQWVLAYLDVSDIPDSHAILSMPQGGDQHDRHSGLAA